MAALSPPSVMQCNVNISTSHPTSARLLNLELFAKRFEGDIHDRCSLKTAAPGELRHIHHPETRSSAVHFPGRQHFGHISPNLANSPPGQMSAIPA